MKAYQLELGDVFIQLSTPENTWKVSGIYRVRNGGQRKFGISTQMGKTEIQVVEGPAAEARPSLQYVINPNVNVKIIEKGNMMTAMRFGKHKGKQLQDVPSDYLVWCYENAIKMLDRQQIAYIKQNFIK
jgi:hypothetical protein|tara:strand:- start:467 stop:853 length:387 start_codon:yes stop_codon:yes gene_type:complete